MATEIKTFHIGAVLSVVGDCLIAPNHMSDVYEIVNWLTGESVFTHQLPRAHAPCRAELIRQHPQLADYDDSSVTPENWRTWLDAQVLKFGEFLPVAPMPKGEPQFDTPIADAIEMMGDPTKVMVIEP